MSREAMKQALEALEQYHGYMEPLTTVFGGPRVPAEQSTTGKVERAITALRQALEQPDDEIDWKDQYEKQKRRAEMWVAKYEKDIGPVEMAVPMQQPADEPVAYIKTMIDALYENGDPVSVEAAELMEKLYTRPQPAAQWVGLTDEEVDYIADEHATLQGAIRAIEAKLKEKNT